MADGILQDYVRQQLMLGTYNLKTVANLKFVLLSGAYVPSKGHKFASDINTWEISGPGYVGGFGGAGRKPVTGRDVTIDPTTHQARLIADAKTWVGLLAGTPCYVAFVIEGTSDADSIVVGSVPITNPLPTTGNNWIYTPPASGIAMLP